MDDNDNVIFITFLVTRKRPAIGRHVFFLLKERGERETEIKIWFLKKEKEDSINSEKSDLETRNSI